MMTPADRGRHVLAKLQKDGLWDIAETVKGEAAMIPAQVCAKWLKWAEEKQGWPKRFIKAEHAMVHETLPFLQEIVNLRSPAQLSVASSTTWWAGFVTPKRRFRTGPSES